MIHQMLYHPGRRSGEQGTAQPREAQTPATRLLDTMDLVTKTTCLCECRGGGSGLQHVQWWIHHAEVKETD